MLRFTLMRHPAILRPARTPLVLAAMALAAFFLLIGTARAQSRPVELDVPFVPTPEEAVAKMLEMAQVGPDDTVIDLGSGDGRIAIAAVKDRKAKSAMGVNIDPERIAEARTNAQQAGVADKVSFVQQDLFKTDISKATVLTMYLLPDVNLRLRPVILKTLAPGTRVVSHAFTMDDWRSDRHEEVDGRNLYLWIVPAQVGGQWLVESPEGPFTLSIDQQFQQVTATAQRGAERLGVSEAALAGDEIRFTIDQGNGAQQFVGKVSGDRITPSAGATGGWRATRQAS